MPDSTIADADVGKYNLTLVAVTVDTITFADTAPDVLDSSDAVRVEIGIKSITGPTDEIWITKDGSTPAVNGSKGYYLPAIAGAVREIEMEGSTVLKLISAGTPTYWIAKL